MREQTGSVLPAREGEAFTHLTASQCSGVHSVGLESVNSSVLRAWPLPRSGRGSWLNPRAAALDATGVTVVIVSSSGEFAGRRARR